MKKMFLLQLLVLSLSLYVVEDSMDTGRLFDIERELIEYSLRNKSLIDRIQSSRIEDFFVLSTNEQEHTSNNFKIGLLSIVLIHSTSLFGGIVLPLRKRSTFKWILMICLGLAIGTLIGTGIFHLIPMSFTRDKSDLDMSLLNKGLITALSIYLFLIRDQLWQVWLSDADNLIQFEKDDERVEQDNEHRDKSNFLTNLRSMRPMGWMLIIGDLIHGFIDGLTIGAISIVSLSESIQLVLPIGFEEFSHKLGNTAVLSTCGLTIKQSIWMNFFSSFGLYPGYIIGTKLGQIDEFHPWICALAGGMFIYVSLADMIVELRSMGNEIQRRNVNSNDRSTKLRIFICQNGGLLFGIVLMFVLAKFGEDLFRISID